jgi:hypothetical protein
MYVAELLSCMEYSESFLCLNRIFPLAEDPTHHLVSLLGFVYKRQTNPYVIREIIKKEKRNHLDKACSGLSVVAVEADLFWPCGTIVHLLVNW